MSLTILSLDELRLVSAVLGLRRRSCGINSSDRTLPRIMYQSRIPMNNEKQAVHMPIARKFCLDSLGENLFWRIISTPRTMKKL